MEYQIPFIKINKSWFYSAGDRFGWSGKGLDKRGVGISLRILKTNPKVVVEIDSVKYGIHCDEALALAKEYNAYMMAGGVKLAVIPKKVLVELEPKVPMTTKTEEKILQNKLY